MNQDYLDRLSQLAMIVHVSKLDGTLDEQEQQLIDVFAQRMNVSDDDKKRIVNGDLKVEMRIPKNEWERIENFQLCMMMTGVNGDFNKEEELYCTRLGLKMGIRNEVMDLVIDLFKKYHPKAVPVDELKRVYQIGHN